MKLSAHFDSSEFGRFPPEFLSPLTLVIGGLEGTRALLERSLRRSVQIIVTDYYRTLQENESLGQRLGWNVVARHSKHLDGLAVDFHARFTDSGERVSVEKVAEAARENFDFVKSYADGHVHADQRAKWARLKAEESKN